MLGESYLHKRLWSTLKSRTKLCPGLMLWKVSNICTGDNKKRGQGITESTKMERWNSGCKQEDRITESCLSLNLEPEKKP